MMHALANFKIFLTFSKGNFEMYFKIFVSYLQKDEAFYSSFYLSHMPVTWRCVSMILNLNFRVFL